MEKYMIVSTDLLKSMEMLEDDERGRLFNAMLISAKADGAPTLYENLGMTGNERFIWPTAKMLMERGAERCRTES